MSEHPDAAPKTTGEHPVTNGELRRALNLNDVKVFVVAMVVAVSTAFGAYRVVLSEARAQSDAGVKAVTEYAAQTQRQLVEHIRDSGEAHRRMQDDMHEVQMDIRALYRSMQTGMPSPRLERPPVVADGGQ